jgi:hypothetical protein
MPLANRSKRRSRREHRARVWGKLFRVLRENPTMKADDVAATVAAEIQEEGETDGFDISILLQLLVTLLPLIVKLFNR